MFLFFSLYYDSSFVTTLLCQRSTRAAEASGITGWACDEESFFEYESVDGPFLPGAPSHQSHAPSFGDAPRPAPAPRDWTRVKARVVCRRDADEEE